jgi:hypothetical protein
LWAKGLNAEDIHKEMFPVCGRKCLSRKSVHNWVEKRGKCFADEKEVETEVRKWLGQQSKDFYAAGFDALVKHGTSVSVLVEDVSRNKCFFPDSNIACFTFCIHLRPIY